MKEVFQENICPKTGDCLSACIASLLHIPLEQVPKFNQQGWQASLKQFLKQKGLSSLSIPYHKHAKEIYGYHIIIIYITHMRSLHAVVGKDGFPVFDPSGANFEYNYVPVTIEMIYRPLA